MPTNPYFTLLAVALGGVLTLSAGLALERRRERTARATLLRNTYSKWLAQLLGLVSDLEEVFNHHNDVYLKMGKAIDALEAKSISTRPNLLTVLELGFEIAALEADSECRQQVLRIQTLIQEVFNDSSYIVQTHKSVALTGGKTLELAEGYYKETPREQWEDSMADRIVKLTNQWLGLKSALNLRGDLFKAHLDSLRPMIQRAIALRGVER